MARRRRRAQLPEPTTVYIEAMSHEGRGIANINGKTVFVFGALLGERVKIQIQKTNRSYDQARTLEVLEASPLRIVPKCEAFDRCGGCSLQHMANNDALELKQHNLMESMTHAGVEVKTVIPALRSQAWGYRRKARLGVKYVRKKARVLVGFRERNAPYLADMAQCEVLIPEVGQHLQQLAQLIEQLDARESIPQIEIAADDEHIQLVFRHLRDLSEGDLQKLTEFAISSQFWIQLQPGGPESIHSLHPPEQTLTLAPLAHSDIRIRFSALDFVQVNHSINQQMVAQALALLDLRDDDSVLDLFCGLGNFTLPMAQLCKSVTGVEGDSVMVRRAKENALENQIDNTDYYVSDLTELNPGNPWMCQKYSKILLDPPRSGAKEIAEIIKRFKTETIVYVSCQPASLVRDSKIICEQGYRLEQLGVMDMFPQTAHVESMAMFKRR